MALKTLSRRTTNTVDMFVQIPMSMAMVPEIAVFDGLLVKLLTAIAGAAQLEPQIKVSTMQAENLATRGRINSWTVPRTVLPLGYPMVTRRTITVGKFASLLSKATTPCRGFEPKQ